MKEYYFNTVTLSRHRFIGFRFDSFVFENLLNGLEETCKPFYFVKFMYEDELEAFKSLSLRPLWDSFKTFRREEDDSRYFLVRTDGRIYTFINEAGNIQHVPTVKAARYFHYIADIPEATREEIKDVFRRGVKRITDHRKRIPILTGAGARPAKQVWVFQRDTCKRIG